MNEVAYLAALVLAVVFAWAGAAKLRTPVSTAGTFTALGLPRPATSARAVPLAELLLAAGLVVVPGAAAPVALALLAGFTVFLARAVHRGTAVSCGCFGSSRQAPVSTVDLVRNGMLMAVAVVGAFTTAPDLPGLAAVITVGAAVAVGALALALADLRRRTGRVWRLELPRA